MRAVGQAGAAVDPARLYFASTGHSVDGKFLAYWQGHGGLPVFGYPLTEAFYEGGRLVQYFERSRFELHPENAGSAYEVLLGQLGKERLKADGIKAQRPTAPTAALGEQLFLETGFAVAEPFLSYWQTHGGLPVLGYPISPRLKDATTGLIVQYFERARFELHPENAGTEYEVLLTLLGTPRALSLDKVLRDPWPEEPPHANLRADGVAGGKLPLLSAVVVRSDIAGDLLLLDGDNHPYAHYPVEAGKPLTLHVAGVPGQQSVMLYGGSAPVAALWGFATVEMPVWGVHTGDTARPVLDGLYTRVGGYLQQDAVDYTTPDNSATVHGYRSPDNVALWLRDHVYQLKGARFFDTDVKSALEYFRDAQHLDGSFDDYLYHTPATLVYTGQIEIEADREFLFVEGVWAAWQATGDDAWLRGMLPAMERGLEHTYTDPRRWSSEYGLVKRAFTIDTWDYEQGSDFGTVRRSFDHSTRWSIMHGDNTGTYHASRLLASVERYFGRDAEARTWDSRADALMANLNRVSWNGHFYTHQVHLTPASPTGTDESQQLSLSNAYALQRGTLTQEMAAEVLRTYQARQKEHGSATFAEWYSIDPAFPTTFGPPGEYANGGIMPLVGGELARGAFDHGFESYGLDILQRYWALIERTGGSYLWYHPDGSPGISNDQTLPTDGWGSSAMLSALTDGLAGVVDNGELYRDVTLSPRWAAAGEKSVSVALPYPASGAYFAYDWQQRPDGSISLDWGGRDTQAVKLHLLLPGGMSPTQALLDGIPVAFTLSKVEGSTYLDATLPGAGGLVVR